MANAAPSAPCRPRARSRWGHASCAAKPPRLRQPPYGWPPLATGGARFFALVLRPVGLYRGAMSTRQISGTDEPVIEHRDQLAAPMAAGEKSRERWRIGTEHEKLV